MNGPRGCARRKVRARNGRAAGEEGPLRGRTGCARGKRLRGRERRARREHVRALRAAARRAVFAGQCRALAAAGYAAADKTVSFGKANGLGALCALPFVAAVAAALFFLPRPVFAAFGVFWADVLLYLAAAVLSVPAHEGLHALARAAANGSFGGITFGVAHGTPYCACARPTGRFRYAAGALAPFAVLGLGLSVAGLCLGHVPLALLGAFNLYCAGADVLVAARALFSRAALVLDHPVLCGFYAFVRPPQA